MITTASLVFDCAVALSRTHLHDLARVAAAQGGFAIDEVTETDAGLRCSCGDTELSLQPEVNAQETRLHLTLRCHDVSSEEESYRRLAGITHALLIHTDASFVTWLSHEIRLPRAAFLSAFGETETETTRVKPRRVTARPTASRARRAAVLRCTPPANASDAPGITRLDAHVLAYEAHMRETLLRDASEEELAELRLETGIVPVEARLSTWAVSIAVATVSLPVAVPVIIYNVARGEDMRVASLAMGLAGLFVALDTSGAMAGIMTGL
ncbi:hypothetical protein FIU97_07960 [Roseivivax sp. THAF40]|uniref:hypothetical protein n=1 Tax=unclassified Roseivivax TaxID=2639302 RepID=UPI0012698251|nr:MULTISPECIES: hypothetical protein [unclassified Roseivivax]QFS82732.1 hypothetical protein FIV09_07855 [Roseivivax sp. THAF197b]QFT46501.1 hypothetical protein FIU97_07960 [Roseivivax sp. THAF40]